MDKPKDNTLYVTGANFMTKWKRIFFGDYLHYEDLPDIVKSEATKAEYEEYWNWKNGNNQV